MKSNATVNSRNHTFKSNVSRRYGSRTSSIARALLALLFLSCLLPAPDSIVPNRVMAAGGDLVPGFGTSGVVMTDFAGGNDSAQAIAATLDGKIIAAGSATIPGQGTDFALACYDENGNLDPSFGTGGKATTDFFGANDGARGVAVQEDGKIVLSGFATNGSERQFAIARFNPDGSLDTTLDQDGKVVFDLGLTSEAFKVALQEDNKIVAVGDSRPQNSLDFTIVRINPDGSTDNNFGTNGVVRVDFGNSDRAIDLAIDEANIFFCGIVVKTATDSDFGIVRLNISDGSLNNEFDGDGKVTTDFYGKQDGAQGIRIVDISDPANPKLLATGFATNDTSDFASARYNFDGSLDTAFDVDGKQMVDFSGGRDVAFGLFEQPDGDTVAIGWAGIGANFDLGMTKWDRFGGLDSGFGLQGKYTLDTASSGNNVAFDGKIYGARIVTAGVGLNPITLNDDFVVTLNENEKFVEFTKTASPDPAVQGELITYTFTIKNLSDKAIEVTIGDPLPSGVSFDSARSPLWTSNPSGTGANSKPFTVIGLETKEVTLVVRAVSPGFARNTGHLALRQASRFLVSADVLHEVKRAEVTGASRDGKNLRVIMNSTGATQSSAIMENAIEPQASCPVVLYDGVEQKTRLDPDNPSTVLIVKKGYKKLAPGQTVRIRVRLCSGIETDDFIYTRPQ